MRCFVLVAVLAVCVAGCGPHPGARRPGSGPSWAPWSIRYEVSIRSAEPWTIDVRATFEGGVSRLGMLFPQGFSDIVIGEGGRERRIGDDLGALSRGCAATCTVAYRFHLTAAAEVSGDSPSVAVRSGGDVVALASSWLLLSSQLDARAPVTLHVDTRAPGGGEAFRFAAPFPRDGATGDYTLVARDLRAAGYTVFGRPTMLQVAATEGVLDVAITRGTRAATDRGIERWVSATARALDTVYGRFPIDRVLLVVVPVPAGGWPAFGRTVPAGGASILLLLDETRDDDWLPSDWVLAHELFHLGVPSIRGGAWLDEGLATYYEPVLRTRAGLYTERRMWSEMSESMPRGAATPKEPSLTSATAHARVYHGGSAFALAADAEIRRRTGGARSLDDGLRRVLSEGGNATTVWSVEEVIAAIDRGAGVPVARELHGRVTGTKESLCGPEYTSGAIPEDAVCAPDDIVPMRRLFAQLGVRRAEDGSLALDDAAPLAGIRRGIVRRDDQVAAAIEEILSPALLGIPVHTNTRSDRP